MFVLFCLLRLRLAKKHECLLKEGEENEEIKSKTLREKKERKKRRKEPTERWIENKQLIFNISHKILHSSE